MMTLLVNVCTEYTGGYFSDPCTVHISYKKNSADFYLDVYIIIDISQIQIVIGNYT